MMMTHETAALKEKDAELAKMLDEMRTRVHEAAERGTAVHEVERAIWQQVLQIGHLLLERFFTVLGTGDLGERVTLPDGRTVERLAMLHERRYVSIFGNFTLNRVVYGSREGQKIDFAPLDNRIQMPESVFSYLLQDWDQGFCVQDAFGQVAQTVLRIFGLQQSVDSLEHMNAQMAQYVDDFRQDQPRPTEQDEGEILVSSADGKGVVMRRAPDEPPPPAHRTKGEKASRKEMAIVGAVYSINRHLRTAEDVVAALFGDKRATPPPERPKPHHKHVMASLASTDAHGTHSGIAKTYDWILEELWSRNRGFGKEMVHLCDGQEALWDARVERLPRRNTTDILDLLHVTPRLWKAAHVFYREKSDEAEAFVRARLLRILQGKTELVVRGMREMGTKRGLTASKKATLNTVCCYLEKNRARMRYDEYLAKGYPIASGVIEGACRHLVKDRMERAGMHWTRAGAQAMLDVRSIHISGAWEQYQTYRIDHETRRLYPWRELVEGDNYRLAA